MRYLVMVLMGLGLAWGQEFYRPLENHPSLLQARYGLEAAQAQLTATQSPLSVQAQGGRGWQTLGFDTCPAAPTPCTFNASATNLGLSLSLTPFPFGDVADGVEQARLTVVQAQIGYRQARSQLEAQALELAYRVRLAEAGVELARSSLKIAQAGLEATKLRESKGGVNPGEMRQSEASLRQAQFGLSDAERNLGLARQALTDLVGSPAAIPGLPSLPDTAVPPAVLQAELQLAQARLNFARNERSLWPVAQASYTNAASSSNSWGASINSRTLQPTLSYNFASSDVSPAIPGGSSTPRTKDEIRLGVSWNFSLGAFDALQAGYNQLASAQAGIEAARRNSKLQEDSLKAGLSAADSSLSLAQQALKDAEQSLTEARERERLGLASPLSSLQSELALAQAKLSLEQAQLTKLSRTLDLYRFYALPLTEVR
jgi:outer membrane protein TolC